MPRRTRWRRRAENLVKAYRIHIKGRLLRAKRQNRRLKAALCRAGVNEDDDDISILSPVSSKVSDIDIDLELSGSLSSDLDTWDSSSITDWSSVLGSGWRTSSSLSSSSTSLSSFSLDLSLPDLQVPDRESIDSDSDSEDWDEDNWEDEAWWSDDGMHDGSDADIEDFDDAVSLPLLWCVNNFQLGLLK